MVVVVDGGACFFLFIFVSFEMHSTVLPVNGNSHTHTHTHLYRNIRIPKSGDYIKLILSQTFTRQFSLVWFVHSLGLLIFAFCLVSICFEFVLFDGVFGIFLLKPKCIDCVGFGNFQHSFS